MCMKGIQSHQYSAVDRKYVNGSLASNDRLSVRSHSYEGMEWMDTC